MSLMGLEVGATFCRAVIISAAGAPLAQAWREVSPLVTPSGTHELDSRAVWAAVREVIAETAAQTRADPLRAIGVVAPGEILVPLSREGGLLDNALLSVEGGAGADLRGLEQTLGVERLFAVTGHLPGSAGALARLLWLREHRPQVWMNTWRWVTWGGAVCHLLGGTASCDLASASRTMLLDVAQRRWSSEVLGWAHLAVDKLPELVPAGTAMGSVSASVARELGLPPQVRVVLAGYDLSCGALGAGVTRAGMAFCSLGNQVHLAPAFHAIPLLSLMLTHGLPIYLHAVPDLSLSDVHLAVGGAILRWIADNLAPLEKRQAARRGSSIYEELLAEMPEQPTALLALPYLAGDASPRRGALVGLTLNTTRGEIIRAFLEGMAFYLAEGVEHLREVGVRLAVLRAVAGGARSERWLQLLADVLGIAVERPEQIETTPLGAALLAGVGSGVYTHIEEAVQVAVRVGQTIGPQARAVAVYQERRLRYRELAATLPG